MPRIMKRPPVQRFIMFIQRKKRLSSWERSYRRKSTHGVWNLAGYVTASNPWEASAKFRKELPAGGWFVRVKAMPTFTPPQRDAPEVNVLDALDDRVNKSKKVKKNRRMVEVVG